MARIDPSIFKAYDVRGIYPHQICADTAYRIGRATCQFLHAKTLAVGRDMRLSSPALADALIAGVTDAGADAVDLGLIGTDMCYVAVARYDLDGGVMVTASHNPKEWNGMKFVRRQAVPISSDSGLADIQALADADAPPSALRGSVRRVDMYPDYTQHVLSFIDPAAVREFKIVADAGNGVGWHIASRIFSHLPCRVVPLNAEPNGDFPKHEPNPMLEENRQEAVERVRAERADMGVMWDGDADRCFFLDDTGRFVEGYFLTALLAEAVLQKHPGSTILSDPRNLWAVRDAVLANGGNFVETKSGHSFMKEAMRRTNAAFGGEMSGHYYFRDNHYADSGMIPVLMVLELMSRKGRTLRELVQPLRDRYFISGEINRDVGSREIGERIIRLLEERYSDGEVSHIDGLSVNYDDWRFNVRLSNTEPLLRLNVEGYSQALVDRRRDELLSLIEGGC
jgi:phosphomannomutase